MHQSTPAEAARADRTVMDRAAAALRHGAIMEAYAGLARPDHAFALALLLDELGRQVRDLPAGVRRQAVASAAVLAGISSTEPPEPPARP